jgi:hypothetical protein
LEIEVGNVVLLVGPNNSGKSLALREIKGWCSGHPGVPQMALMQGASAETPDDVAVARALLAPFEHPRSNGQPSDRTTVGIADFGTGEARGTISFREDEVRNAVRQTDSVHARQLLVNPFTLHLDAAKRLSLAAPMPAADARRFPDNHLMGLLKDRNARESLRKMAGEAFGLYPVIDPTRMTEVVMRMSGCAPTGDEEESLGQHAIDFFSAAAPLDEFSDGVKSFVGILAVLLALPFRIVLLDDPEAFLHPPHARLLGRYLSQLIRAKNGSLVASTHSPQFLMGCVEEVANVAVVRLTYQEGLGTARALAPSELELLMRDPLLRSADVLSALFHRGAVVTEADSDRALYEELNRRLLIAGRGVRDALFVNAQNAQTVPKLVGPLRKIGVPAVALLDLDAVTDVSGNWDALLGSCLVPEGVVTELAVEKRWLIGLLPDRDRLKLSGVNSLSAQDRARAQRFLDRLADYGLLLVPVGEMESWFREMGIPGHGSHWLVRFFSRIGRTPFDSDYLAPRADGVWDFIDRISRWIGNPDRLGT